MRIVEGADIAWDPSLRPAADLGTVSVLIEGKPRTDGSLSPAPEDVGVPEPFAGIERPAGVAEDAADGLSGDSQQTSDVRRLEVGAEPNRLDDEAERMTAAGFALRRGAWRKGGLQGRR